MPSLLTLIWLTALGLALFACVALAGLICARLLRQRDERDDPDRRARVSKALLQYATKEEPPPKLHLSNRIERLAVLESTLDAWPFLRPQAKQRLEAFLRARGLDKRLRRQARAGSIRDRVGALEALAIFPDAETIAVLKRVERSKDLRIWLEALRTRTAIGAGPDMEGLLQIVERPGARRAPIMHELLLARAKGDPDEALKALQSDLPPLTRALLIRVIGETQRPQALKPIRDALASADGAVRAAAAEALGALGLDAGGAALARAMKDDDWRVRLKACEAIGELGLWRYASSVEKLLDDPIWWVRLRAEEALERLAVMRRTGQAGGGARAIGDD